jgi:amidase
VAGGLADVALGADTGGSVRVPSSWCGLFGMRPTHGRFPVDGLVSLTPRSDTVGWFSRSGAVLRTLDRALLADAAPAVPVSRVLAADDLLGLTDPGLGDALRARADAVARR